MFFSKKTNELVIKPIHPNKIDTKKIKALDDVIKIIMSI
ncbi:unnamed protein product [Bacillus thuringiensis DB27]|uniref:Uncharacterized protein n=1 Tax=Bacillus thuringiensis DB27 TaxID=1431339 RepID=W8YD73_BACTU|nr:unnamed protein product [Bacillus thuringiensis DB27]